MRSREKPEAITLTIDVQQFELASSCVMEKIIDEKLAVHFERLRQEIVAQLASHQRSFREESTNQAAEAVARIHMPGTLVSPKEVSQFLGISPRTIRLRVDENKLPQPIASSLSSRGSRKLTPR